MLRYATVCSDSQFSPSVSHQQTPALHAIAQNLLAVRYPMLEKWAIRFGPAEGEFMSNQTPSNYFEYIIRDADSYRAVLSGANVEIFQLEPGRLSGRHVRLGLKGGQFSYVESSLSLRGIGTFPNLWTLSVVLESKGRSLQHGIEVSAGSLFIHGLGGTRRGLWPELQDRLLRRSR